MFGEGLEYKTIPENRAENTYNGQESLLLGEATIYTHLFRYSLIVFTYVFHRGRWTLRSGLSAKFCVARCVSATWAARLAYGGCVPGVWAGLESTKSGVETTGPGCPGEGECIPPGVSGVSRNKSDIPKSGGGVQRTQEGIAKLGAGISGYVECIPELWVGVKRAGAGMLGAEACMP